jgi:hypothetical protein
LTITSALRKFRNTLPTTSTPTGHTGGDPAFGADGCGFHGTRLVAFRQNDAFAGFTLEVPVDDHERIEKVQEYVANYINADWIESLTATSPSSTQVAIPRSAQMAAAFTVRGSSPSGRTTRLPGFNLEVPVDDHERIEKVQEYVANYINADWIESLSTQVAIPRSAQMAAAFTVRGSSPSGRTTRLPALSTG